MFLQRFKESYIALPRGSMIRYDGITPGGIDMYPGWRANRMNIIIYQVNAWSCEGAAATELMQHASDLQERAQWMAYVIECYEQEQQWTAVLRQWK